MDSKHGGRTFIKVLISGSLLTAAAVLFAAAFGFTFPGRASAAGNSRGRYLFNYYNCIDCHMINGIGGTLGPSLSGYGRKNKSYGWTAVQIKNPQSHYPTASKVEINGKTYLAVMPAYNYIPQGDVREIIDYLNSLRK